MSPADSPFAQLPAPGPHPATAELRAYAAGTLAPADEHRIEAHTLDCERCADLVEGFSMSDAPTTDHAVAELRTRLQARLGTEEPAPVAGGWAWPRIAAAAAVLGVVAGGIWTWEQHTTVPPAATARLETAPQSTPAAPAPRPAPTPANTPAAAVATAPAAPPAPKAPAHSADYAANAPRQVRRRPVPSQDGWASAAAVHNADQQPLAAAESSPEAVADDQKAQADVGPLSAAPASTIAAASPVKSEVQLSEVTVTDTFAHDKAPQAGRAFAAKAKVSIANQEAENTARVANTAMPAAPAINPAPVGGTLAFREYLRREAAGFDPEINNLRLSGTVRVKFVVGADGKLSELKVSRGLRKDYDEEALRIVCDGPAWQPGIAGGRRAPLPMEVTVPF
jgi:hypothetical protein